MFSTLTSRLVFIAAISLFIFFSWNNEVLLAQCFIYHFLSKKRYITKAIMYTFVILNSPVLRQHGSDPIKQHLPFLHSHS